jgi:hypothetical protein
MPNRFNFQIQAREKTGLNHGSREFDGGRGVPQTKSRGKIELTHLSLA